jgi:hypothetical protein
MAFRSGVNLSLLSLGEFNWEKTVSAVNELTKEKNDTFVYPVEILHVLKTIENSNLFKPDKNFPDEWKTGKDVHEYCISGKINYTEIIEHKTTPFGCSHPNKFVLIAGSGNHVFNISDIHANEDGLNALVESYCDHSGKLQPNVIFDINGDMINRGKTPAASVRTLLLFMILRVKNRNQLVLKRGNHELEDFISIYGKWLKMFPAQGEALNVILKLFKQLPLISYLGHKECGVFAVHGAPSGSAKNIREIFCENLNPNNVDGYTHVFMSKEPTSQEIKPRTIYVYPSKTDEKKFATVCHTLKQVEKFDLAVLQLQCEHDFISKLEFPKSGYKIEMLNPHLIHYITLNEASIDPSKDEEILVERYCGRYVSLDVISLLQDIFGKPVYIFTGHKHGNSGTVYKKKWFILVSSEGITKEPCVGYSSPDSKISKLTFVETLDLAKTLDPAKSLKQKNVSPKFFDNSNAKLKPEPEPPKNNSLNTAVNICRELGISKYEWENTELCL